MNGCIHRGEKGILYRIWQQWFTRGHQQWFPTNCCSVGDASGSSWRDKSMTFLSHVAVIVCAVLGRVEYFILLGHSKNGRSYRTQSEASRTYFNTPMFLMGLPMWNFNLRKKATVKNKNKTNKAEFFF